MGERGSIGSAVWVFRYGVLSNLSHAFNLRHPKLGRLVASASRSTCSAPGMVGTSRGDIRHLTWENWSGSCLFFLLKPGFLVDLIVLYGFMLFYSDWVFRDFRFCWVDLVFAGIWRVFCFEFWRVLS